jgi:beta-glucosidase
MKNNKPFTWGVSTASYQIEGSPEAQGKGKSIWDTFSHTPEKIKNGDTGDVAVDHYNRWREDIDIISGLGVNAYRFSVSWSRVLPEGIGKVNEKGLAFYDQLIDSMLEKEITPFVTLYHWDLPQVLEDKGGWLNRSIIDSFGEYSDLLSRRFGDRVQNWITLNEPNNFCFSGYYTGRHAPGRKNETVKEALQVTHHAMLAHGRAIEIIRSNCSDAHSGISLSLGQAYPLSESEEDLKAAQLCDGYHNRWFADPIFGKGYPRDMLEWYGENIPSIEPGDMESIAVPIDFLGLNAYCPDYVRSDPDSPFGFYALTGKKDELNQMGLASSDLGWPIVSESFSDILQRIHREYSPKSIYITENGLAEIDECTNGHIDDQSRIDYLDAHISAALDAKEKGVPLDGYFVWSMMDNFEWAVGFSARFGLVFIDYKNDLKRIPKASYYWFRDYLKERYQ